MRKFGKYYIGIYCCKYCEDIFIVKGKDKLVVEMELNYQIIKHIRKHVLKLKSKLSKYFILK